jgi:hypothetical protein
MMRLEIALSDYLRKAAKSKETEVGGLFSGAFLQRQA